MSEPNNTEKVTYVQAAPLRAGTRRPDNNAIALTDVLIKCLVHWPWFLISLALCVGAATYHVKSQEYVYSRSASILIKSESRSGKGTVDISADLGKFQSGAGDEGMNANHFTDYWISAVKHVDLNGHEIAAHAGYRYYNRMKTNSTKV